MPQLHHKTGRKSSAFAHAVARAAARVREPRDRQPRLRTSRRPRRSAAAVRAAVGSAGEAGTVPASEAPSTGAPPKSPASGATWPQQSAKGIPASRAAAATALGALPRSVCESARPSPGTTQSHARAR